MSCKVFVITCPQAGHLNPLFGILSELVKNNFQVVVYSTRKFQTQIEQTKAEFRAFENMDSDILKVQDIPLLELIPFLDEQMMDIFDNNGMKILKEIILEQPDLILYDIMAMYAKWIIKFFEQNQTNLTVLSAFLNFDICKVRPIPKTSAYCTSFLSLDGVYPNDFEKTIKYQCTDEGRIRAKQNGDCAVLKMSKLSDKYSFDFAAHMKEAYDPNCLNIVFTFPEFQPRSHLYDQKRTKFIGSCIDENVRLNGMAENFTEVDQLLETVGSRRLVYASFGTVFSHKLDLYTTLLEAFNSDELSCENIFVVISTGAKVYEELNKLIELGVLKLADNIKLVRSIAQLKMLKHASLFLTHCGFNSISEAIHFGVPMICLPISAEQPINALYIAHDLNLGHELDVNKLTASDVVNSVKAVLNDGSYMERSIKYSELSRKYNGPENAAKELRKYLEE